MTGGTVKQSTKQRRNSSLQIHDRYSKHGRARRGKETNPSTGWSKEEDSL